MSRPKPLVVWALEGSVAAIPLVSVPEPAVLSIVVLTVFAPRRRPG